MHEVGIALGIVELVREHVSAEQAPLLRVVRVRVGPLSGVSADALETCFEGVVAGTDLEGARLLVVRVPARFACRACEASFESGRLAVACPRCASPRVRLESGAELSVEELELADPPGEPA